jgi:hypothetical protein
MRTSRSANERLATLEQKVSHMEGEVAKMAAKVDEMHAILLQALGRRHRQQQYAPDLAHVVAKATMPPTEAASALSGPRMSPARRWIPISLRRHMAARCHTLVFKFLSTQLPSLGHPTPRRFAIRVTSKLGHLLAFGGVSQKFPRRVHMAPILAPAPLTNTVDWKGSRVGHQPHSLKRARRGRKRPRRRPVIGLTTYVGCHNRGCRCRHARTLGIELRKRVDRPRMQGR